MEPPENETGQDALLLDIEEVRAMFNFYCSSGRCVYHFFTLITLLKYPIYTSLLSSTISSSDLYQSTFLLLLHQSTFLLLHQSTFLLPSTGQESNELACRGRGSDKGGGRG